MLCGPVRYLCCANTFSAAKCPSWHAYNNIERKNNISNDFIFHDLLERSQQYNDSYWCMFGYTGSGKTYTTEGLLKNLLQYYQTQPENSEYVSIRSRFNL